MHFIKNLKEYKVIVNQEISLSVSFCKNHHFKIYLCTIIFCMLPDVGANTSELYKNRMFYLSHLVTLVNLIKNETNVKNFPDIQYYWTNFNWPGFWSRTDF